MAVIVELRGERLHDLGNLVIRHWILVLLEQLLAEHPALCRRALDGPQCKRMNDIFICKSKECLYELIFVMYADVLLHEGDVCGNIFD